MQLEESFTVLEDGEPIATFDAYSLAVEHIDKHAARGRKYQIVKELLDPADAPRQTVADTGWREEYRAADDQQWYALTPWAEGEPDCRPWNVTPTRIVRRRVSKPEVINA